MCYKPGLHENVTPELLSSLLSASADTRGGARAAGKRLTFMLWQRSYKKWLLTEFSQGRRYS